MEGLGATPPAPCRTNGEIKSAWLLRAHHASARSSSLPSLLVLTLALTLTLTLPLAGSHRWRRSRSRIRSAAWSALAAVHMLLTAPVAFAVGSAWPTWAAARSIAARFSGHQLVVGRHGE